MDKKFVMKRDENGNSIPVLSIGIANDVADTTYNCTNSVVRITAIVQSRVWYHNSTKSGSGLLLPEGASVDVSTRAGYVIEVTGNTTIMEYQ